MSELAEIFARANVEGILLDESSDDYRRVCAQRLDQQGGADLTQIIGADDWIANVASERVET
jgi:hypothetical protein